jgi:hypothetical protein
MAPALASRLSFSGRAWILPRMSRRDRSRRTVPAGTLGTLMRGALSQATVLIERGAQGGKARLDEALRDRRRREALARLGELALPHLRAGRPDELLDESEVHALLEELDGLDDEAAGERAGGTAAAVVDAARGMFSSMRTRWDPRGADAPAGPALAATTTTARWPRAPRRPAAGSSSTMTRRTTRTPRRGHRIRLGAPT